MCVREKAGKGSGVEMVKSLNSLMKVKQTPVPHLYAGIPKMASERFSGKSGGKIVPSMHARIELVVYFAKNFIQYRVFQFRGPCHPLSMAHKMNSLQWHSVYAIELDSEIRTHCSNQSRQIIT